MSQRPRWDDGLGTLQEGRGTPYPTPSVDREPGVVSLKVEMKVILVSLVVVRREDVMKRPRSGEIAHEIS